MTGAVRLLERRRGLLSSAFASNGAPERQTQCETAASMLRAGGALRQSPPL
jgi:hypothetical protein